MGWLVFSAKAIVNLSTFLRSRGPVTGTVDRSVQGTNGDVSRAAAL